jgi:short-subunit dehydrogenase
MDLHHQTALVTGASSGIGAGIARELASRGAGVVLVARRLDRLEQLAAELSDTHGVPALAIAHDLTAEGSAADLARKIEERGLTIDMLVNNAGFATHGAFVDEDAARVHDEITLNVTAVVELTHAFLPGMVERNRGFVVNVASTGAFQPVPTMAVYGATKAFVLSFTEALWGELEGTDVAALALCPGATDTEFFDVVGDSAQVGPKREPVEAVVRRMMQALERRTPPPSLVSGWTNALGARLPRVMPRKATIRLTRRVMGAGAATPVEAALPAPVPAGRA